MNAAAKGAATDANHDVPPGGPPVDGSRPMRERTGSLEGVMRGLVVALAVILAGAVPFCATTAAAGSSHLERAATAAPTELSSQRARQPRARTRIRVTPLRRSGRLVRECDFRLVREARASGVYVVPRQRCWWARR